MKHEMAMQQLGTAISIFAQGLATDPGNANLLQAIAELECAAQALREHSENTKCTAPSCKDCRLWLDQANQRAKESREQRHQSGSGQ